MKLPKIVTFRKDSGPRVVDIEGQQASPVNPPSRELLRMHATLGSVLYTSRVVGIFDRIHLNPLDVEQPNVGELHLPDPDGMSFWKDLVDAGGPDLHHLARLLGVTSDYGVVCPLPSEQLQK